MGVNLLRNWVFCEGSHLQDGIPQIGVPDEWRLDWLDNSPFEGIGAGLVAYRPESVVVDLYSVSPEDQQEFFYLNGESTRYAWKIFKGMAPMYAVALQDVRGLTVGQRYKFTMWVYADIVRSYIDGTHFSEDIWAAEARAGIDDGIEVQMGEWHNVNNGLLAFGEYRPVTVEFTPEASDITVQFDMKAKWGLPNNGWWLWGATLEAVDEIPPSPGGVVELGVDSREFLREQVGRIVDALSFGMGE